MAQETFALQTPHSLRLLIVAKQPAVRAELAELCQGVTDVELLGETASGQAAIDAADNLVPDLMLIEVALPDMSGFDVLRAAGSGARTLGIMISHQSDHAARAFAEGAVDYLVKPISPNRFVNAIDRARQRYIFEDAVQALLTRQLSQPLATSPKFLVGERHRRLYPLAINSVDYIEADHNYVTMRVGETEYISRNSIKRLSSELGDFGFLRIDRSILLNVAAVHFAEPVGRGTLAFTLTSGVCLRSSRTYRDEILRILPWRWGHARGVTNLREMKNTADPSHSALDV
jgi:two-component system LytT family response regulator